MYPCQNQQYQPHHPQHHCQPQNPQHHCPCHRPHKKCDEVLAKFHELVCEARKDHAESDELTRYTLHELKESICALERALYLDENGDHLLEKANSLLNCSGCDRSCNKDNCHCKRLLEEAKCAYNKEERQKVEALELLRAAAKALESALMFDHAGDELFEKYLACVHTSHGNGCGCGHNNHNGCANHNSGCGCGCGRK